ncbi:hypothetical protein ATG98_3342 [Marinobacter sp. LV10R520-4]|uniref:hypothetical protein n=1 Tax=Marinobacter sp. LV10R520-4 TaxID=1761796 RepID=UPI000BF53980|nr:hypothetical protein [Marinobacter sp. LV10R520-4]PFG54141.1 hypothetical protein ATG98_3342 [Marinobacter sp. LV10R520-4]
MDREQLVKKLRSWEVHLEVVVGTLAFGLAVGCAGIGNNYIALAASVISIYISFRAIDVGAHYFPTEILELRENSQKTRRQIVEHAYVELQLKKTKTPLLYLGILSLFVVALMSFWSILAII